METGTPEKQMATYQSEKSIQQEILTINKITEQRNLGTLAYKIKCEWETQMKKSELRFEGQQGLDFT
jgi:hypothetical protein